MTKIQFKKGDFLTQESIYDSFAIWEGNVYKSKKGINQYSLIVYGNNTYNTTTKTFKFITHVGCNGKDCGYVVNETDLHTWRKCTQSEINTILLSLAKSKYKWDNEKLIIEKMDANEHLVLTDGNSLYNKATTIKKRNYKQKIKLKPMTHSATAFLKKECDKYNFALTDYHPLIRSRSNKKKIRSNCLLNSLYPSDRNYNFMF